MPGTRADGKTPEWRENGGSGGERMIIAWRAAVRGPARRNPPGSAGNATQRERREPQTVRAKKKQEQQCM
ncbi:hypothetical protein BCY88_09330 [Paraburkholderia fungorum]|uniref:Uncharacterized protein n=1 Tax=Paraburkholderia fungorum TaxID=134537 RepID=A0A420FS49_9BURK|nr:hypothetical protein BCY88_09330 [Paraburkholderia fungorum]